jgi:hypothetical protein
MLKLIKYLFNNICRARQESVSPLGNNLFSCKHISLLHAAQQDSRRENPPLDLKREKEIECNCLFLQFFQ